MFFNGKGFLANTTPVQNNYTNPNTVPYCIKSNKYRRCNGGESNLFTMEPCDRNVFKYTYMYVHQVFNPWHPRSARYICHSIYYFIMACFTFRYNKANKNLYIVLEKNLKIMASVDPNAEGQTILRRIGWILFDMLLITLYLHFVPGVNK